MFRNFLKKTTPAVVKKIVAPKPDIIIHEISHKPPVSGSIVVDSIASGASVGMYAGLIAAIPCAVNPPAVGVVPLLGMGCGAAIGSSIGAARVAHKLIQGKAVSSVDKASAVVVAALATYGVYKTTKALKEKGADKENTSRLTNK